MATNKHEQRTVVQLHKQLIDREAEIELLKETISEIGSQLDLNQVFQTVASRALTLIQAETLLIPIIDESCNQYTYRGGAGKNSQEIIGESLPLEFGICGWVWRHRRAWWRGVLEELSDEERTLWEKEAGSVILVPLKGRKHFLGGIAGINKLGGGEFDRRDLNLLTIFASSVAIIIENAMAFRKLEQSRQSMENYQRQLEILNRQLTESSRELENLSLYDPVTGLPNRSLLRDRLNQYISIARENRLNISLLLIDLNHFKEINDTLGHENGDLLLQLIAGRFSEVLYSDETFSRLGGDEFMLILPKQNTKNAHKRARKFLKLLEEPFEINHNRITVSASIGVAAYPDHGDDISTLMRHADNAMYNAKNKKLGVFIYNPDEDYSSIGQLTMTTDLRRALDDEQFELYCQPKIDFVDGRVYSAELLGRWNHPESGFIAPTIFINSLEQTGLIDQYTEWVVKMALQQVAIWKKQGRDIKLAVNISTQTLTHTGFLKFLETTIPETGLGEYLIFEITESLFLSEFKHLSELLTAIRDFGITLSIDDFGTGYSSLSRLKRLPVSEIKIDRSFVIDMHRSNDDRVIVKSTIDLAHNLGLSVVAEGIETEQAFNSLKEMDCDIAQGYFIGKPVPLKEFEQLLNKLEKND